VLAVGICGTDRQRYRSGYAVDSLGHEAVVEAGGRRYAMRPLRPCHACQACRAGASQHCHDGQALGRQDDRHGALAGQVVAHRDQLHPLPDDMQTPLGVLADPLACLIHACAQTRPATALVLGDGPMAALAAIHLRLSGVGCTTVGVKSSDRVGRLRAFADQVLAVAEVETGAYDMIVECVGGTNSAPLHTAINAVRPRGRVVCLGVYPVDLPAAFPIRTLLEKEATLVGSKAYPVGPANNFGAAVALLGRYTSLFQAVITATVPLGDRDQIRGALEHGSGLKTVCVR
jgi:threonine dehydrogenase-like Zn-dependent dehydrogenase